MGEGGPADLLNRVDHPPKARNVLSGAGPHPCYEDPLYGAGVYVPDLLTTLSLIKCGVLRCFIQIHQRRQRKAFFPCTF